MYNFGIKNFIAAAKAPFWKKDPVGSGQYFQGKPPVDNAFDNNYQFYTDNAGQTGAIPTFKPLNTLNQFEVTAGQMIVDGEYRPAQLATPATPTATVNGTAGATSYTYAVVARAGSLQVASATVNPTTGNATLTGANSITITWNPVQGANYYDIYRTASSGTPSTTGLIGTVNAGFNSNVSSTATLSFTDTGLTGDGSTLPAINTTGAEAGQSVCYGIGAVLQLATPAAPLVTSIGTTGATTYTYKIVARGGTPQTPLGATPASAGGSTSTGNAALSAANASVLVWQPVPGAASYDIYRTVGGATQGKIGNVSDTNTFTDSGLAGDSSTAPTLNTTGLFVSQGADVEGTIDNNVTGSATISAANMLGGILRVTSGTDTSTTDTAANIVAAIPNCQVGSTFALYVVNGSGNTHTLALGSSVTAAAGVATTLTTATANTRCFLFRVTSVGTPAVTVYSLGASAS